MILTARLLSHKGIKYIFTLILFCIIYLNSFGQNTNGSNSNLLGVYCLEEETDINKNDMINWYLYLCENSNALIQTSANTNSSLVNTCIDSIPLLFQYDQLSGYSRHFIGKYIIHFDTLFITLNQKQYISFLIIDTLNLELIRKSPGFSDYRSKFAHRLSAYYPNHKSCEDLGINKGRWVYNGNDRDTVFANRKNNFWMYSDSTKTDYLERIDAFRIYDTTVYPKYKQ